MNALTIIDRASAVPAGAPHPWFEDPLDPDRSTDAVVRTTRRALTRVALIAAEAGARFQREGEGTVDPMAWMLAPRRLFAGAAAIEACLERGHFMRGLMLHGLSLGTDADPADVDALLDDGDDGHGAGVTVGSSAATPAGERGFARAAGAGAGGPATAVAGTDEGDLHLFTATVVSCDGFERVHAFHASLAHEGAQIAGRLFMRMGAAMADVRIVEGFDASDPLVDALVAPALCDTLALIAADPSSPLAAGLDLNIEQRFLC